MTPEQQATAKRWMERPVAKSCNDDPLFFDPPHLIQKAMGGSQWFFEIGAKFIHRVGLFAGLAWELPYGEAGRNIDYIKITREEAGYTLFFGTRRDKREDLPVGQGIVNPFDIVEVVTRKGLPIGRILEVYQQETMA